MLCFSRTFLRPWQQMGASKSTCQKSCDVHGGTYPHSYSGYSQHLTCFFYGHWYVGILLQTIRISLEPHIKQPYFSHIKQPFFNGSNALPSLNATCSPSRFFATSTERSAILASTAVTLKPIKLPSLSGFWSPFTWRSCLELYFLHKISWLIWVKTLVVNPKIAGKWMFIPLNMYL